MTDRPLAAKTILITGATRGIGRVAALELARLGARMLIAYRDAGLRDSLMNEIKVLGNDQCESFEADLSSQKSIRELAAAVQAKHKRIDALVNNAGGIYMKRRLTADGLETTFAVNHLGYFLLTNLLLDTLKASAPARIVNTASGAHKGGKVNFNDLQSERNYGGLSVYSTSKLENIMFTYELARRLEGTGVTANCLHPGAVATHFAHNDKGNWFNVIYKIGMPFLISPEKGARTIVYLASSPQVEGVSGKYFFKCREKRSSARSYDEEAQKRLWAESAKLTGVG